MIDEIEWSPVAVLPNLSVPAAVGNDFAMICSKGCEQIDDLLSKNPELRLYSDRFSDCFGQTNYPAFVLFHKDFSERHESAQALIAFRNIVAVSSVTLGKCFAATGRIVFDHASWSESFDFYPWMLGADMKALVCNTPALNGIHDVDHFNGQLSPKLDQVALSKSFRDDPLLGALLRLWTQSFVEKKCKRKTLQVFRSLEMAFSASRIPYEYAPSHNEVGREVALWVSALEILVHPGGTGRADKGKVVDLLNRYAPHLDRLRHKKYRDKKTKDKSANVNLLEKTGRSLYKIRNDYLHGNPVTVQSLTPRGFTKGLQFAAPALYRMALFAKLEIAEPTHAVAGPADSIARSKDFNDPRACMEKALLAVRNGNQV